MCRSARRARLCDYLTTILTGGTLRDAEVGRYSFAAPTNFMFFFLRIIYLIERAPKMFHLSALAFICFFVRLTRDQPRPLYAARSFRAISRVEIAVNTKGAVAFRVQKESFPGTITVLRARSINARCNHSLSVQSRRRFFFYPHFFLCCHHPFFLSFGSFPPPLLSPLPQLFFSIISISLLPFW